MSINITGKDIILMRKRYDEALQMQGIPCKYQYPHMATSNEQGASVVDSYSDLIDTHIFLDGNPKIKTYRRYGWVVENDENLPFLLHCSFHLEKLQRDSLFRIAGQYTELPDRIFRVKDITMDLQAPDHLICQVLPVYDESNLTGRTKKETAQTFNKSNTFLKPNTDYRGNVYDSNNYVDTKQK